MRVRVVFAFVACLAAFAGFVARADDTPPPQSAAAVWDPQALPTGSLGDAIKYGRSIIMDTHDVMKGYVRARMDCASCHVEGGTVARAGTFAGTYAYFPQYNKRSNRIITLQDRLAECFLYSMNGHPPSYASKEMVAMVAYIAWLSRGTPSFSTPRPADLFIEPLPAQSPNATHGAAIYAAKCATCHQSDGAGIGTAIPPLWGNESFNNGAGMAHIDRMTGFVRYNMPKGAAGTLSQQEAYDVSTYVLAHPRPTFNPDYVVRFDPLPAKYF